MNPQLESITAGQLHQLFDAAVLQRATALYQAGAVIEAGADFADETIWAEVADGGRIYGPEAYVDSNRLMLTCTCQEAKRGICAHMGALIVAWVYDRLLFEDALLDDDPDDLDEMDEFDRILDGFNILASGAPVSSQPGGVYPPGPPPTAPAPARPIDPVADYRKLLNRLTVPRLRKLAARRGVKLSGNRRDPILDMLAEGLSQPENIAAAVETLTPEGRLALDVAVILGRHSATLSTDGLTRLLKGLLADRKAGRGPVPSSAKDCLDELAESGLIVRNQQISLPASVLAHLPPDPRLLSSTSKPGAGYRRVQPLQPQSFARLTIHVLLLAQAGKLQRSPGPSAFEQGGWPTIAAKGRKRSIFGLRGAQQIVPQLSPYLTGETLTRLSRETGAPARQLDYLARLLAAGGLWKATPQKKTLAVQPDALAGFLGLDPAAQARYLFNLALNLTSWTELDLARANEKFVVKRQLLYHVTFDAYLQALARARGLLVRVLSLAPAGVWLDLEQILRLIHQISPDFFVSSYGTRTIWLERSGKATDLGNFRAWRDTYGHFYTTLLAGPLHWLGLCETGHARDRLVACRLTEFSEFLLGRRQTFSQPAAEPESPSLTFDPGLIVRLDPAHASTAVLSLVPLAGVIQSPTADGKRKRKKKRKRKQQPVQAGARGRDHRLTYRITPAGAARAFEAGWTAEKILATLTEAARIEPPLDLEERLLAWWDGYGRLHLYSDLALIEFADDFALPELLAGTALSRHLLYRFSPRLVAVRPEGVEELLADLEAKGYTPRLARPAHD